VDRLSSRSGEHHVTWPPDGSDASDSGRDEGGSDGST
jgi:hypothetical protein